jgi:molecular chaperone GrpE
MIENKDEMTDTDDLEPTDEDTVVEEELEDIEENSAQKIKKLKEKLKETEKEKMACMEDLQRAKADFLNSKRRMENERMLDRERAVVDQIEKLLPLCDSFQMAMNNKEAWAAVDENWRRGIEGIHSQLQAILASYGVKALHPEGEAFDPERDEAMGNVPVDAKEQHHMVIAVIQDGYIRTTGNGTQLIRPARVTVGEYQE